MKDLTSSFMLNNGLSIPCVGYGTFQTPNDETCAAVLEAIKVGYRHIDTAAFYGNEEGVGEAVRKSGVPREQLFITSKVWNSDRGYEKTKAAFAKTIGGALPILAKFLKADPAIMAAPLITTIVDALSLIIYFTIASHLLPI